MSDSGNQSKESSEAHKNTKKEENVPLLFLGNLAPDVKDSDLKSFFGKIGTVKYVHIPTTKHTGESKGVGYIQYENIQDANKAIQELDGKKFQGRHIRVQFARPFSETEKKRAEKRQSQLSKSKRGSDVYSPDRTHRSSGLTRRDYDIPRDQYEDSNKTGSSMQSTRKQSSPPLQSRRDAFDERDHDLLRDRDRDRYERERSRDIERYRDARDYYDRDAPIPYDPMDLDYERDRGLYRDRIRDRERDSREKDLRDWDRIRSDRDYESRREPSIMYESVSRMRDADRDLHDRYYDRPREYYDRDDYYYDRDRDRDYYHMLYSERNPIQYDREYDVQTFDPQQAAQIQVAAQQLPPSPQLTVRDFAQFRAAPPPLPPPPLPGYESRDFDDYEYYGRAQPTVQSTSTPTRLPQPPSASHYIDYDDKSTIPTDLPYDGLVQGGHPPLPTPPPLPPQQLTGPQPLPSPQALQKIGALDGIRLPPGYDLSQAYDGLLPLNVRAPISSMIPPPPPPQTRPPPQQPQQPPLPLPSRLAATHGLHSQYDQQIDNQNQ